MEIQDIQTKIFCPKNKKNSACSGIFEGKCEVYNENYCIFYISYLKNKKNNNDNKNNKNIKNNGLFK